MVYFCILQIVQYSLELKIQLVFEKNQESKFIVVECIQYILKWNILRCLNNNMCYNFNNLLRVILFFNRNELVLSNFLFVLVFLRECHWFLVNYYCMIKNQSTDIQ